MDKITELLTRGVANIIPGKAELEQLFRSGRKLNVYCGFDVTAPQLHIGNTVPMRKLQAFVDLGHNVTFLIGDFTTLVGDTSDKDTERPVVAEEDIDRNWHHFARQAGKILDLTKVDIRRNSEWLDQLSSREIVKLMRRFSLNDFISRELIKKRLTSGGSVNLAESFYPVLQGYDSYHMDTDVQVGATDQTFNMQAGRQLQKQLRNKESFVVSFEFLMGTDGRKMSKSWSNAIWLDDEPADMYGKIMALHDDLISQYFLLATNLPEAKIQDLTSSISNPMDLKKKLAHQIVSELHSASDATAAQTHFESVIQQGQNPTDIPEIKVKSTNIIDVLVESGLSSSKSDARRLIDQGGVEFEKTKVNSSQFSITNPGVLRVGRRFAKILVS